MTDLKPWMSEWLSKGVGDFVDRYDGFAIDQWGVLHDGQRAYPGAIDCLQKLSRLNKSVVILTNSGKRASLNVERIAKMGFDPSCYTAMVSSGEVTWSALKLHDESFFAQLGRRCLLFSQGGDRSIVEDLDIQLVDAVETADFILLAGIDNSESEKFYEHAIVYGSMHNLPLICANPDEIRITSKGLLPSCGAMAHRYEALGGERVCYIGKPFPEIYRYCRKVFGELPANRIIAIGDSLQHDVVGAAMAGFATAFVMEGIHKQDFMNSDDVRVWQQRLLALSSRHGVSPDWVMPSFKW